MSTPSIATANSSTVIGRICRATIERNRLNCSMVVGSGRNDKMLLFRVNPVVLYGPKRTINTFALLDEGSSVSLIDDTLATDLGLDGVTSDLDLQFANTQGTVQASREIHFGISGTQSNAARYEMNGVYTASSLTLPIQTVKRSLLNDHHDHLFAEYKAARPRLLIGLDHHHLGIPLRTRTSALADGIVAAMTKLGWVLFGSDGNTATLGAVVHRQVADINHEEDERWAQLNDLVRQHYTTENFGVKTPTVVIEYVKNLNAQFEYEYPEAAEAVRNNHYVYDYVSSFRTSADAYAAENNWQKQ